MGKSAEEELLRETARYRRIKADREELKLRRERGELAEITAVRKQWSDMAANVRKKLLALEARLPRMVAGKDAVSACEVVHKEVYDVLSELSEEYRP